MQIVVLGMHRSGTSAITGILNMMGAYFGPEDKFIGANQGNPKGHWERYDVLALHEQLMHSVGAEWYQVAEFEISKLADSAVKDFQIGLAPILADADAHRPWVIKDPRLCLTFSLWRPLLKTPVCIYMHRSPIQIAQSLKARNGVALHVGIALWEKYMIEAFKAMEGVPRIIIQHQDFMAEPVAQAQQLYEQLSAHGVTGLTMPDEHEILRFIEPTLFRSRGETELCEAFVSVSQQRLLDAIVHDEKINTEKLQLSAGALDVLKVYEHTRQERAKLREAREVLKQAHNENNIKRDYIKQQDKKLKQVRGDAEKSKQLQLKLDNVEQQVTRLIHWLAQLDINIDNLLKSRRWQVGDFLIHILERLLFRPKVSLASDSVRQILSEFRQSKPRLIPKKDAEISHKGNTPVTPINDKQTQTFRYELQTKTPATSPGISIIILNLNGAQLLENLFNSILEKVSYQPIEFLVVEHASSDNSLEILETFRKKLPLKILLLEENRSFAWSNNYAARQANYDFLLFLNNDIIFTDSSLLQQLIEALSDPKVGIAGPLLEYPDKRIQHAGIKFGEDFQYAFQRPQNLQYKYPESSLPSVYVTPAVTAALAMCRKEDFLAVGGFCEDYFYGYEDVDLCLQFYQKLKKVSVLVNSSHAIHDESTTQNTNSKDALRERRLNNIRLLKQRFGYALNRVVSYSRIQAQHFWSEHPFTVGFAVTEAGKDVSAGDYFTAMELGSALQNELGWQVRFLPKRGDLQADWYDLKELDALIVMVDAYELPNIHHAKPTLIKICWMRNWFERWMEREWFGEYDIFLCSSTKSAEFIKKRTGKNAHILRIATNHRRFEPSEDTSKTLDYCFTGSYWNVERDIEQLEPEKLGYNFAVYGHRWDRRPKFKPYWKGFVQYEQLPGVYQSSKILLDDANHVTKPWGSVNSRVFDALAAGVLVISNGVTGAREVFGEALPTYETPAELTTSLKRYLADDKARMTLTKQLQTKVLKEHTYVHRAKQLQDILLDYRQNKFRIAIKVPAPNHAVLHEWGDYYFALALQRVFTQSGHSVRIDILPEWDTPLGAGDDVVLVLRGLSEYTPKPEHINLMWNISHPDKVSTSEYEQYDHVFIASQAYADKLSTLLNTPVSALLQCTDETVFYRDPDVTVLSHEILFVGNSRKQRRKIVQDAIDAGLPLSVYGGRWEGIIEPRYVAAEHIANTELRKYYSRCGVLLNDHWPTMRENGFISNRLFDAGACGAVMVSDGVDGLGAVFGDLVTVYDDTPTGLTSAITHLSEQRRQEISKAIQHLVLEKHTFAQRAETLMQTMLSLHAARVLPPFDSSRCIPGKLPERHPVNLPSG